MIFGIMIKNDHWAKGTDVEKPLNVTDLEHSKIINAVSFILLSKKEFKGLVRQIIAWMKY